MTTPSKAWVNQRRIQLSMKNKNKKLTVNVSWPSGYFQKTCPLVTTRERHFLLFSIKNPSASQASLTNRLQLWNLNNAEVFFLSFFTRKKVPFSIVYILGNPFLNSSVSLEPHQTWTSAKECRFNFLIHTTEGKEAICQSIKEHLCKKQNKKKTQ